MKAFKKLALVTAIAAAPFAQAELTSIDDAALSDMTGQAGISIELSAKVDIGSVVYTDTDGLANNAGSLAITGITLGGSAANSALDNIKIDIDVDETDGLIIHLGAVNNADVLTGNNDAFATEGRDHQRVDFGLGIDSVSLNGSATNLASAINIQGNLGPVDVKIANDGTIDVDAYFEVTTGSMNVDVLGLGVTNLTIGDDSSPILSGAYATDIANFQTYAEVNLDPAAKTAIENTDPTYAFLISAAGGSLAPADALSAVVRGGAVAGVSNMAYVQMQITTGSTGYSSLDDSNADSALWTADTVVVSNSLQVEVTKMNMDIGMDLSIGSATTLVGGVTPGTATAASLGHVAINDLNLSGTTLKIYGH